MSYLIAEGRPLTFLDHRLVVGDSLTGPFYGHLRKYPGSQQPLDGLFTQGLTAELTAALAKQVAETGSWFGVPPSGGSASKDATTFDTPHAPPAEAGTPNPSPSPFSPPGLSARLRGVRRSGLASRKKRRLR